MKAYGCLALIAVLVALSYSSCFTSAASIELEQYRYDFYDNDDEANSKPSEEDEPNSRHKREEDYDSPYDLAMEDRTKREEDYDSPYDLAMEDRTKREEDYDSPYDLAMEGRTKRQADLQGEDDEISKRDYDDVEARTEPWKPVETPIRVSTGIIMDNTDEDDAEENLPANLANSNADPANEQNEYDLGMDDRTKREEDYDSPYDLALEGRTKREEDYDSPYGLALEGRTKRQASAEPTNDQTEAVNDIGKRDYGEIETRKLRRKPKVTPVPVPVQASTGIINARSDENIFFDAKEGSDEDIFFDAVENLPGTPAISNVKREYEEDRYTDEARFGRSDEYDYDEDDHYVYEESPESSSVEDDKESCESTTTNSPSVDRHDYRKTSSEEYDYDYGTSNSNTKTYPTPAKINEDYFEFEPYPGTTEEPEVYTTPSVDIDYDYTPRPIIERLETIPSEPIPGSPQDPEIVYDAPNAYADATMGAQPSGGVVIYPVSPNDLDDRELNPGDTELVISEPLVAPPTVGKEYRIAGNVHLEEVPAQK